MRDRITIAAIISPRQSGSTILTYLLGAHPKIATVGETKLPPGNALCSCGARYEDCTFWRGIAEGMQRAGLPFDMQRLDMDFSPEGHRLSDIVVRTAIRGPALEKIRAAALAVAPRARRELGRMLRRSEVFAEVVTGLKGCRTFLDGTKRPGRALHLRRSERLDVKVIHLIRDGRANSWSAMRHGVQTPKDAAIHWLSNHQEAERARRYFPEQNWIDIKHEDVCADPEAALRRLHGFLGVESLPIGDFRADQHILGNTRTRTSSGNEIRLDERWKSDLTDEELVTIEGILGQMNRKYGYASLH